MGFKFLENNKDKFDDKLQDAIQEALTTVGHNAENYVRSNAPKDTGRLQNSITHVIEGDNKVIIGTNVEYAPYQELGTSKMNPCNHGKGFMRPAINQHMGEFENTVAEIIEKAMK